MSPKRRHAKTRKPRFRWSKPYRRVLVRRKDVTAEEYAALPIQQKYPPKLFAVHDEPFRCGTPMIRAAKFVGPPKPSIESRYRGYPLTNWKRKRLNYLDYYRYMQRRFAKNPRYL